MWRRPRRNPERRASSSAASRSRPRLSRPVHDRLALHAGGPCLRPGVRPHLDLEADRGPVRRRGRRPQRLEAKDHRRSDGRLPVRGAGPTGCSRSAADRPGPEGGGDAGHVAAEAPGSGQPEPAAAGGGVPAETRLIEGTLRASARRDFGRCGEAREMVCSPDQTALEEIHAQQVRRVRDRPGPGWRRVGRRDRPARAAARRRGRAGSRLASSPPWVVAPSSSLRLASPSPDVLALDFDPGGGRRRAPGPGVRVGAD